MIENISTEKLNEYYYIHLPVVRSEDGWGKRMNENIVCTSKDAHFAELVLRVIDEVECPRLMCDGEKEAVRKGLMLLLDRQFAERSNDE